MGILRNNVSRQFITSGDAHKNQILFKWPDENIRKFSTVIVEPDQMALFTSRGKIIGTLPPGRWELDATELPILGNLIDYLTDGNAYKAELYFVGTREYPSIRFGGRLDEVQDPASTLIVTLRAFGEYSLKVTDTALLITNLTGTINVADNNAVTDWVNEQLFKVMRQAITTQLVSGQWQILGLSTHLAEIEATAIKDAGAQLANYGLTIARMGNIDINLTDDDNEKLKKFANDIAYTRLSGSFGAAAQAQALQGLGEGMAQGGGGATPAIFAGGLGLVGGALGQTPPQSGAPATGFPGGTPGGFAQPTPPAAPDPATAEPEAGPTCSDCQADLRDGAKFCDSCGTPVPVPAACTNCQNELRDGAKFCDSCGTPA